MVADNANFDKEKTIVLQVPVGGMKINRLFTKAGEDPLNSTEYEYRTSIIRNKDGSVVFELKNLEIPKNWTQVATDIVAQKYFRKTGVPQFNVDGTPLLDENGKQILGGERSVKQVVRRLAGCWRSWGEKYNYFASADDAQAFEDELQFMLVHQMASPNSPQWFNTGLAYAYGIRGNGQGHYYVDVKTGELKASEDAYSRPQAQACFIQSVKDDLLNDGGIFDLVLREARVFKYGSGTGSNFSNIRGRGEKLSGGGTSSGLMSFLKIFDRAAGAVKSGGTTRRAAKMVILNVDHPEIEEFVMWKTQEEAKVADMYTGSRIISGHVAAIMRTAKQENTTNWKNSEKLKAVIVDALTEQVPFSVVTRALQLVEQGVERFEAADVFDMHYEGKAYETVSGQNSNNSVRVTNEFLNTVASDGYWNLTSRTNGQTMRRVKASELYDKIAYAAWACADPGLQYDDTIQEWHTCPVDGKINATNPCSEYVHLDDTSCNLASINLMKFLNEDTGEFKVNEFIHATRLWTIVLEISVLMAHFPSKEIAMGTHNYRNLGLGFANLGTLLMVLGIPYDSDKGRAIAGSISAMLCGQAYATSAEMAQCLGSFPAYQRNKEHMLKVIRNHRRAAYNAPAEEYEKLTIRPVGINATQCPAYMLKAARECWDNALELGEQYGYRNGQVTVIAPTGTIGLQMDCDTTGVEPDFAIVKYKKLAGGGYLKIVNQSVKKSLKRLGYTEVQIRDIEDYCKGKSTLNGCPHINVESLKQKGFTDDKIAEIEKQIATAFDLTFVFNKFTLGEEFCQKIGFTKQQLANSDFNMLKALNYTDKEIQDANNYVCGTMTIEGAPHLKQEHYEIFDCANKCGKYGKRFIQYDAHLKMMSVVQPFISGAISKTINMPNEATIQDVKSAYNKSWNYMLKAIALYRDGSKLSQPLNSTASEEDELTKLIGKDENDINEKVDAKQLHEEILLRGQKKRLPTKRTGFVQEARIGGHKIHLRTGEYPDGGLGEIFIDMYKEGAGYRSILNCFAIAVSKGLQYGVPLQEYVDTFAFTRFEPSGVVAGDEEINNATSMVDYVFRVLEREYVQKRSATKQTTLLISSGQTANPVVPTEKGIINIANAVVQKAEKPDVKRLGFTGEQCGKCGSMKVKQNGSCSVCMDCGETTGCS